MSADTNRRELLGVGTAALAATGLGPTSAAPALAQLASRTVRPVPLIRQTVPADLRQVIDRAAVIDVVNRTGLAADARDWASVRACFDDRVTSDYSSLTG